MCRWHSKSRSYSRPMHHRHGELSLFTNLARCHLFVGTRNNDFIHRDRSGSMMKFFRDNRGATLVEFALVTLPVFVFILGIMQTAWIVWIDNSLQVSVDAAARCGA